MSHFFGMGNLIRGSAYVTDASETLAMTQNLWTKITNATSDLFTASDTHGITFASDAFTIISPGKYMVACVISFSGNNTDIYQGAFAVNGTVNNNYKFERKTSSLDTGNAGVFGVLDLSAGDVVDCRLRNTGNDNDGTIVQCNFIIFRMGA